MKHLHQSHHTKGKILYTIYFIGFIFTLQLTLPVYVNSSFLSQFVSENTVSLIYAATSVFTILGLSYIGIFLRRFGNYKTTLTLILLQIAALLGVILSDNIFWMLPFFMINLVFLNLISFNIDVFLEAHSNDTHTGSIRGLYMTALNIAWILSPMIAGALVVASDYWKIYAAAIGLLLPLIFLLYRNFRNFKDPQYLKTNLRHTFKKVLAESDFRNLFLANIILQAFYSWMVIYTPIYLHQHVGFSWEAIGVIFTIMLLPFVIFQFPAGSLADKKWGEKEFMSIGFFIMGFTTLFLGFIHGANVWLWATLLFITRVGASVAEIMIETYFFKHIHTKDDNILSAFRMTRPISYIVAPIITIVGLYFVTYDHLFVVLGIITLCGLFFTHRIHDTK